MTKNQAIAAMLSGSKVTHSYFSSDEWITMEGNLTIITEEGYSISVDEFWKYRQGEAWESGWSIWIDIDGPKVIGKIVLPEPKYDSDLNIEDEQEYWEYQAQLQQDYQDQLNDSPLYDESAN